MTEPAAPLVDAHLHIWDISAPWMDWLRRGTILWPLNRDIPWSAAQAELDAGGVGSVILVEAGADQAETGWLLDVASHLPRVAGVVGWLPLDDDLERRLDGLPAGGLVGIRHRDDASPENIVTGTAIRAARVLADRGLVLDVQMPDVTTLTHVRRLAETVPELTMVVNHLGRPDVTNPSGFAGWAAQIAALAEFPGIYVKYSGWSTKLATVNADQVRQYVGHVLGCMGADRVLWASNWPVSLMAGSYGETLAASREAIPRESHEAVFFATARAVYGLP